MNEDSSEEEDSYNPEFKLDATRAARWGAKDSLGNLTAKGRAGFHAVCSNSSRCLEEWSIIRLLSSRPYRAAKFQVEAD